MATFPIKHPAAVLNPSAMPYVRGLPSIRGWYAVHLRSKHERVVADRLRTIGVEHYLPIYRSLRQWKDRRVWLDSPLFPGYLFVRIPWADKLRVVSVPGVISILGTENSAVDGGALEKIKLATDLGLASPSKAVEVGEKVRVVRGPFQGLEGMLVRKDREARLIIYLDGISQPFILRASATDVEPIQAASLYSS